MIFFPFQFIYLIIFLLHPHEKLLFFMKWPRSFWTICEFKIKMEKSLDEISGWIAHYNPNTSFPFYSQFVWKSFPKKANIWIIPTIPPSRRQSTVIFPSNIGSMLPMDQLYHWREFKLFLRIESSLPPWFGPSWNGLRPPASVQKALPVADGSVYLLSRAALESSGGVGCWRVGPESGAGRLAYAEVSHSIYLILDFNYYFIWYY